VREQQALDLVTALEKMSLLPARRLEKVAPVFARKGRLQVGADADITIFDPRTIIDHSTYREPFQASQGVCHLLVNGEFVVRDSEYQEAAKPGRLLTGLTP
jgi:dihydroorotase